jgi:hypothetical protein
LDADDQTLKASDYFVVNGCQSLTAIYNNRPALTDNLRVLVKFIKMDPRSDWARMITEFSNNQNSVKPRDFKANNPIQIRLQNEFSRFYAGQYTLEIKRGETLGAGQAISNENAGLYLMAFDLKEPWATHRKYEVFEDKHADLFGRPEVTADRIAMCQVIVEAIQDEIPTINNTLLGRYVLTRYCLLFIVRCILEKDELAEELLTRPEKFVRDSALRTRFSHCIKAILGDVIVDLNAEVDEYGDNFDYRDKLRDAEWVRGMSKKVVADYLKQVKRGRIPSFKQEWDKTESVKKED